MEYDLVNSLQEILRSGCGNFYSLLIIFPIDYSPKNTRSSRKTKKMTIIDEEEI